MELAVATQREDARQRFNELLRARLTTLGFHVQVDPEYTAHRPTGQAASGGFHDPYTGEFDPTRLDSSPARVLAQSLSKYPVAAVIYPAIIKTTASFQRGDAAWDGATQPAFEAHSKLGSLFNVAKTYVGRLDALSLYLRMWDTNGATI